MGRAIRDRVKKFFRSNFDSDANVEFLRMFLLPFASKFKGRLMDVDDVLASFFNLDRREIFYVKVLRDFKMPGRYYRDNGGRPMYGYGDREVKKDRIMLIILDKKARNAKIEVNIKGKMSNFLLEEYEFKTIADWLERVNNQPGY